MKKLIIPRKNSLKKIMLPEDVALLDSKTPLLKAYRPLKNKPSSPILDVEIALRRCRRVGVFRK